MDCQELVFVSKAVIRSVIRIRERRCRYGRRDWRPVQSDGVSRGSVLALLIDESGRIKMVYSRFSPTLKIVLCLFSRGGHTSRAGVSRIAPALPWLLRPGSDQVHVSAVRRGDPHRFKSSHSLLQLPIAFPYPPLIQLLPLYFTAEPSIATCSPPCRPKWPASGHPPARSQTWRKKTSPSSRSTKTSRSCSVIGTSRRFKALSPTTPALSPSFRHPLRWRTRPSRIPNGHPPNILSRHRTTQLLQTSSLEGQQSIGFILPMTLFTRTSSPTIHCRLDRCLLPGHRIRTSLSSKYLPRTVHLRCRYLPPSFPPRLTVSRTSR